MFMQMLWQTRQKTKTTTSITSPTQLSQIIQQFTLVGNHELILRVLEVSNRMVTTNFQKVSTGKTLNQKLQEKIFFMQWEHQMVSVLDIIQTHIVQSWVKDFHNHLPALQDQLRTNQTDSKPKRKNNSTMKRLKWKFWIINLKKITLNWRQK